jgi:hypothetical protein
MQKRILPLIAMAALAGVAMFSSPHALRAQDRATQAAQADEARARAAEAQARTDALRREAEAARREALAAGDIVQKVIQVQHADVQALEGIFRDWVASIRASQELKLLTVAGKAEAIARLEEAIKELDVPGRWTEGGSEITKSFTLTNATTPQEIQEIATTLRGALDLRRIFVVNSTNTLVIRATPDQLEMAQQVIDATDKPRPATSAGNVEFVVQLIEGIDQATPGPPKGLEEVIRQLSNTFPYGGYRLVETFIVRAKVGDQNAEVNGLIPNIAAEGLPPAHYSYSVRARAIVPQGSGRVIQLEALRLNLRVPVPTGNSGQYNFTDIGIQTEMSVPEGKTVVVGKAGAAGPIRGLFLVMTAKVVE